jgi:hypothetical protein
LRIEVNSPAGSAAAAEPRRERVLAPRGRAAAGGTAAATLHFLNEAPPAACPTWWQLTRVIAALRPRRCSFARRTATCTSEASYRESPSKREQQLYNGSTDKGGERREESAWRSALKRLRLLEVDAELLLGERVELALEDGLEALVLDAKERLDPGRQLDRVEAEVDERERKLERQDLALGGEPGSEADRKDGTVAGWLRERVAPGGPLKRDRRRWSAELIQYRASGQERLLERTLAVMFTRLLGLPRI